MFLYDICCRIRNYIHTYIPLHSSSNGVGRDYGTSLKLQYVFTILHNRCINLCRYSTNTHSLLMTKSCTMHTFGLTQQNCHFYRTPGLGPTLAGVHTVPLYDFRCSLVLYHYLLLSLIYDCLDWKILKLVLFSLHVIVQFCNIFTHFNHHNFSRTYTNKKKLIKNIINEHRNPKKWLWIKKPIREFLMNSCQNVVGCLESSHKITTIHREDTANCDWQFHPAWQISLWHIIYQLDIHTC